MNLVDLAQHFGNEDSAREYLEKQRWPEGVVCPHCGLVGEAYRLTTKEKTPEQIAQLKQAKKRVQKTRNHEDKQSKRMSRRRKEHSRLYR